MAGYYARQEVKRQIRARGKYWLTFALAKGHHSNGSSAARRAAETSSLRRQRHRRSFTSARGCFAKLWGVDRATLCAGSLILSDTASACDDYLFDRDVICLMFACSRSMGRASCDDGQRGGGTPKTRSPSHTHQPRHQAMLRPIKEGCADGEEVESGGTFSRYKERTRRPISRSGSCSMTRQPCVMFGYGTHDEATTAWRYIVAALIGVETVRGLR
jgi:hypothetical protein